MIEKYQSKKNLSIMDVTNKKNIFTYNNKHKQINIEKKFEGTVNKFLIFLF